MNKISNRKVALIAGISLLIMAAAAGFSYGFAFDKLFTGDNGTAIFNNIVASQTLLRLGIFGFFIVLVMDLLVTWALYIYFKDINKNLSLLTAWFRLIYSAVLAVSLLNIVKVAIMTSGPISGSSMIYTQVMFFIESFTMEWSIGLMLFGLHLFFLGFLSVKSTGFLKILGYLIIFAGVCYFIINFLQVIIVDSKTIVSLLESILSIPMALAEIVLAFWLIFKGGKELEK